MIESAGTNSSHKTTNFASYIIFTREHWKRKQRFMKCVIVFTLTELVFLPCEPGLCIFTLTFFPLDIINYLIWIMLESCITELWIVDAAYISWTSTNQLLYFCIQTQGVGTKRKLMQKWVYSISKSTQVVYKTVFFSKSQNHCRGTSAQSWITTALKRTRPHCPIYWKTSTLPVLFH